MRGRLNGPRLHHHPNTTSRVRQWCGVAGLFGILNTRRIRIGSTSEAGAKENDSMVNETFLQIAPEATEWKLPSSRKVAVVCLILTETGLFSLVGLHASHVIVGMCLLLLVFIFSLRGYATIMHRERLQMISWYWHFVDAVWIVVFTVVYVIGR